MKEITYFKRDDARWSVAIAAEPVDGLLDVAVTRMVDGAARRFSLLANAVTGALVESKGFGQLRFEDRRVSDIISTVLLDYFRLMYGKNAV